MRRKVLFTSDIHGNEAQFRKLVDYALAVSANYIIVGGDIAPKHFLHKFIIEGQRCFLEDRLPELLSPLKEVRSHGSGLFLMMGNDDCAANLGVLRKNDPRLFRLIHGKRIKLTEEFDIVGYSFVPITPFGLKDWEKYDFSEVPVNLLGEYEEVKRTNYRLSGVKSTASGLESFRFTPEMEKVDSIQNDLFHGSFHEDAEKTVYVFHTPPYETILDQVYAGYGDESVHLGSMAVRLFIERYQPPLTLHGHIHETVELSGDYKQEIGKTLCLSAGNSDMESQLAVLVFDLYNPRNVSRELI